MHGCATGRSDGGSHRRAAHGGLPVSKKKIEECIRDSLEQYFKDLRGTEPHSVHDMIVGAVEKPMLEVVMRHAEGNQSKAAEWLGINRNTLRRKLLDHKLIK
jgi:Fis family transcriptional regulator, factor for inversion stimulation protein